MAIIRAFLVTVEKVNLCFKMFVMLDIILPVIVYLAVYAQKKLLKNSKATD